MLEESLRRDDGDKTCYFGRYLVDVCSQHYTTACFAEEEKEAIMRMWVRQVAHDVRNFDNEVDISGVEEEGVGSGLYPQEVTYKYETVDMVVENMLDCPAIKRLLTPHDEAVVRGVRGTGHRFYDLHSSEFCDWKLSSWLTVGGRRCSAATASATQANGCPPPSR